MRRLTLTLLLLFFQLVLDTFNPTAIAQYDEDEPPEFLPGLVATYHSEGSPAFERVDSDLSLDWSANPNDERIHPHKPLSIQWKGLLQIRTDGPFDFTVYTNADVQIEIDGQRLFDETAASSSVERSPRWVESRQSKSVPLRYGRREIEVRLTTRNPSELIFKLFWSDPSFQMEPIPDSYYSYFWEDRIKTAFQEGRQLARQYRCAACHQYPSAQEKTLAAPSLTHLNGNLRSGWLEQHLAATPDNVPNDRNGMPYFGLPLSEASLISSALMHGSQTSPVTDSEARLKKEVQANQRKPKKQRPAKLSQNQQDRVQRGSILFASRGCLACHVTKQFRSEEQGRAFQGGDLTDIALKRSSDFFLRLLHTPDQVNADHRMPQFELSAQEQIDLAAYLSELRGDEETVLAEPAPATESSQSNDVPSGIQAIHRHRCSACHTLPPTFVPNRDSPPTDKIPLTANSAWDGKANCLTTPDPTAAVPGFALGPNQSAALKTYITQAKLPSRSGLDVLAENNCLACHRRGLASGIAPKLANVASAHPELAARLAALNPPSLSGVGDKLHSDALQAAIERRSPALRPWLDVRMPKYPWKEDELQRLVNYFVDHDRIPDIPEQSVKPNTPVEGSVAQLAANRLVTSAGFGCQSCHAIGDQAPPKVDLKAQGTNLAMLGKRIRPSWFQRWVRDPSRIVPRMEMPGIKIPAKGILDNDLDKQLDALWHTLNQPDFRPPRPGAVRVVRSHNQAEYAEATKVVTNVIETPQKNYIRPLVFGLPNRNNLLFDNETGVFAGWWLGDTASQHTRGKTWFWECGSEFLNANDLFAFQLIDAQDAFWKPSTNRQVAFAVDRIEHLPNGGIQWLGRLAFSSPRAGEADREVPLQMELAHADSNSVSLSVSASVPSGFGLVLELPKSKNVLLDSQDPNLASISISAHANLQFHAAEPWEIVEGGLLLVGDQTFRVALDCDLPAESFPTPTANAASARPAVNLDSVPGFEAVQLPLPSSEMPISFAWGPEGSPFAGQFFSGSLKGRVFQVLDRDKDGLEDTYLPISHEVPAPYGLHVTEAGVDVLAKYALLRFQPHGRNVPPQDSSAWDCQVLADGWGMTADYHDWAVGVEVDREGNYYIALPCQQDDRDGKHARYRGQALRLLPSLGGPRAFRLESISAGLRFPMGLVRTQDGELFATDNQGNYNPFNELNHLQSGKRYGFINKLESKPGFSPDFESPAINLPHPWTRSVNGICELRTPDSAQSPELFGPFEGHLLGCEMNGRSLIRMSLQKVDDQYQGAAYLFSQVPERSQTTFEGPIVCEVSPKGEIYIGNLHDSGWGGGQNTGSIVRLSRTDKELPIGIAEVRATPTGFDIDFTRSLDTALASRPESYQIRSYRKISTPAYGGDDQDERSEEVASVKLAENGRSVQIKLQQDLRAEFVYELTLEDVGANGQLLFPNQAHYTMRKVPNAAASDRP